MRIQLSIQINEHDKKHLNDPDFFAEAASGLVDIINSLPEGVINEDCLLGEKDGMPVYGKGFDVFHQDELDDYADRIVPDDASKLIKWAEDE